MAYTLAQLRRDTRGLPGTLKVVGVDEGSNTRPWQQYRVRAAEVDVESAPTQVELIIVPNPKAQG